MAGTVNIPREDLRRLRKRDEELRLRNEWIQTLPLPAHFAILHLYVASAAKVKGKECPVEYQYEGMGVVHCPGCGRTESAQLLTDLSYKCPECGAAVKQIPQYEWDEEAELLGQIAWEGRRGSERLLLFHTECMQKDGKTYTAPEVTRPIRLYGRGRLQLTVQEAYELGWRLLRMAQSV